MNLPLVSWTGPRAGTHRQLDRILLTAALEYAGGSQREAARLLGIARQTLRTRLQEAGLCAKSQVDGSEAAAEQES
jgi:two-component system nitrogen regulation response regulator GlnG